MAQTDSAVQLYLVVKTDSLVQPKPKKPLADTLINYANSFYGKNYYRGGIGVKGFDCSGFTMQVFAHFGIKLPHTSAGQGLIGVQVKQHQAQKGDLIFFRSRNRKSKRIGHVGIIISSIGEPIKFIHSSTSEGVRVDALNSPYYKVRFMKITRVLPYR